MAAYAALVSLMNNIEQIMKHPRLSTSLDNKYIQPLLEKASFLLAFIEGHSYGGRSTEVADLERQIASAAHAAEDVIESHIVDQIHAGTSAVSFLCSLDLQQIIQDMDAILEKATEVKKKWGFKEEKSTRTAGPSKESGDTAMVGLDDKLIQLLDELTGYQPNRHIISIVGMGGIGKTTLAKNIYENPLILEHFDIRAWATISQQHDVKEILSQLHSSLGKYWRENESELGEKLHKTLSGRRYLIILDDIWSIEAWDEVRRYLPNDRNRSRVVLTTRLSNLASVCSSSCFKMNLLDEEKSWKLFCQKALFPEKDDPPELENVGKEIVRLCKGLALSIVVIGGFLLKSPRVVGYWNHVLEDLKSIPNPKEKQEMLDVLSLSYNHLPPHLKPCFIYMGIFKEDSQIPVSKIVKLWVAEGFLKPNGLRVPEEVAESYINDLIDRNIILVGERRRNGKIKSCGIHDLLRDLCLKIVEQQEFFHFVVKTGTERRVVDGRDISPEGKRLPLIRSMFMITSRNSMHVHKYKLLRVFDEFSCFSRVDYYKNVNLRYLALSPTDGLLELSPSISHIWNLQDFIIKTVSTAMIAPTEFWQMRQLRHVECKKIYLPRPPPSNGQDELLMLENLQTLKSVVNLRLCEETCKMIPNLRKLHLLYGCDLQGYDDSLIECLCNLDRLHKLQSLKLRFNVTTYSLLPDTKLNKMIRFPCSLNELSLSGCQLHWQDLTVIGSLLRLEVLKLDFYSVTEGEEWSPVEGQFLRLKFLKIHDCNLIRWNGDQSHFPVLEKLVLSNLYELEEIPLGIGDIPTLELICVNFCSESAAISAVRIKDDQLEKDNDELQVRVRVCHSLIKIFKEKMEIEGLTTDNIQFQKSVI